MEAGSLGQAPETRVWVESEIVYVEPADPAVIYVPVYDVGVVYGPWWWPGYPPYAWTYPWYGPIYTYYGAWGFTAGVILWGGWYHHHAHPDWHHHRLAHRRPGHPPSRWTHNPIHRGGVPYSNRGVFERHVGPDPRVHERQEFRGFERAPQVSPRVSPQVSRQVSPGGVPAVRPHPPAPTQSPPSALNPIARDSARIHAERGRQSLGTAPRASPPASQRGSRSAPLERSGARR
jgi:hypothetical protein